MPEQLMLPTLKPDSYAAFARRFTLSASLSAIVVCCGGASVSAQSAAQPTRPAKVKVSSPPATTPVRTGKAQVKANDAAEKPAAGMPAEKPTATTMQNPTGAAEIMRARRANAPAAATATSPAPVDATAATNAVSIETDAKATEAELDKLRADIKAASATAERARLQRALVERLTELDRNADALAELRLMLREERYDPAFFFNTGNALVRLGDAGAAAEAYRKAISQRRGNYARALNNLGVVLIRQGNWDEAQQTLTAALVQENYAYAEASYNLGRLHLLRGEADLAIREWRRTLHLEPAHAEATVALARAYTEDGDAKRALAVLDNFIARSARSGASIPREITEVRRELVDAANVRTSDGNIAADGDVRLSSSNLKPRPPAVDRATYDLLQTARGARERGDYAAAAKQYRAVLARSPGGYFAPANLELGTALMNLHRREEALAALLPLTQKDAARYPVAYYHLGRLYEGLGQLELSAKHFARAAELYGDANPQMLLDLSRIREKTGDHPGALAAMDAYIKSIAQQGTVPEWATARQEKLSGKISANRATQNPTATP